VASTDAFALKNSDLNAFLFADVGTELNGSALTILSVLARLGQDPWAAAARWANMPKAAAIQGLAQSIGKMPLTPQALAETFATASALVQLLPVQARNIRQGVSETSRAPTILELAPITLLVLSLIFGVLINAISDHTSTGTANVTTPAAQIAHINAVPDRTVAAKPLIMPTLSASDATSVGAPSNIHGPS
jgi:hypothetical protein